MSKVLGLLLIFGAILNATPLGFTATGTAADGAQVSAYVSFDILDSHHFTISITDEAGAPQSLAELLAGLNFDLAASGLVLISSNGELVEIGADGSETVLGSGAAGWALKNAADVGWVLCATCGDGQGYSIIGSGPFTSADAGTYLTGTVTFEFSTTSSLPTDGSNPFSFVTFSFGPASALIAIASVPSGSGQDAPGTWGSPGTPGGGGSGTPGTNGSGTSVAGGTGTPGTDGSGTPGSGGSATSSTGDPGASGSGSPGTGDPGTPGAGGPGTPQTFTPNTFSPLFSPASATVVPEPDTVFLSGAALLALAFLGSRVKARRFPASRIDK